MALLPSFPSADFLAGLQLGDHLCLPVSSDIERRDGTAVFADVGLRDGDKVLVVAHTETSEEMTEHLVSRIPGARHALAGNQFGVLPSRDVYLPDGAFDPEYTMGWYFTQIALAQQQGFAGLRVAVDAAWSVPAVSDLRALLDYEIAANPAFADGLVAVACIYQRDRFCPHLLEDLCRAHPLTPGQAPLRFARTAEPPGLALTGEVDLTNHSAFSAVLDAWYATPGHLTVDASGLRFVDLRGADLLAQLRTARGPGTTTIVGSPLLERLLELTTNG